ncbi:PAS domain S-box protein [Tolypothrix sp. VBCCA 56010]|uniref:PAS domain S-box protein n=1 Tax=Tolypothrix sp. VBCCA 56010 TaxID=3137731 RepID=UPI003D7E1A2E
MQALAEFLHLPSIESVIDFSFLTVAPATSVIEAIALLSQKQASAVLVIEEHTLGWFTPQDVLRLISHEVNLKTTQISQVMNHSVITLKKSDFHDIATALSLLRQHQLSLIPIVDEQNELLGIVTFQSICQALETKVKRDFLESASLVETNEDVFRQLVENICEVFFVRDLKENKIVYVSPAYEKIWGRKCSSVYENALDFTEAIHPEDRDRIIADITAQTSGKPYEQEYRILRPDGEVRWIWSRTFPLKNELGEVYRITGIAQDITLAKQATELLRESEQRFHTMADSAPVLIWMADKDGLCTFCNQALLELTGRTQEQELGNGWTDNIHPEDKRCIDNYFSAFNARECFQMEYRLRRADGEYRWLLDKAIPRFTPDGNFAGYIGCCIDITELKQTNEELETRIAERTKIVKQMNRQLVLEMADRQHFEDELRRSQQMLQLVLNNIPQRVFWKDRNSVYLGCNQNFANSVGFDNSEDIVGKTDYDLLCNQQEASFYRECDARVMQTNTPEYKIVAPHIQRDGKQTWLETNKVPLHNTEGKVVGILGTFEDITVKRQAESALRETQERLQAILDNSPAIIYVVDIENRYLLINRQFQKLFNMAQQQIVGKSIYDIWSKDIGDGFAVNNRQVLLNNISVEVEEVVPQADGLHTYLSVKFPLLDSKGVAYGVCGISTDITQRKRIELELRQSEERFRTLVEGVRDYAIFMLSPQGQIASWNFGAQSITGYQEAEIIGQHFSCFQKLEESGDINEELEIAAATGRFECEGDRIRKDGSHFWANIVITALRDETGLRGFCKFIHDITERKQAEETLLRLRKAIESSSDAIGISDIDGQGVYVNPAFIELFAYTAEELNAAGGPPAIYTKKSEFERIFETVLRGESWRGEVILQTRIGRIVQIDLRADAIKDAAGKIIGTVGIHTDITERKRVEQTLKLRDRAIATCNNGIIICDVKLPDSPLIYVNAAFERTTGYTAVEVIGRNCRFLQASDTQQPEIKQLRAAIRQEEECTVIIRNYRKDGTLFWNKLNISPVFDVDGVCTHYIGIQTDVSEQQAALRERKLAETILLVLQQRLQYLLDSSPGVIYTCKTSGNYRTTFVSENIVAMLGYEAQEFLSSSSFWASHIHPEDAPQVFAQMSRIFEQEQYNYEYRFLHQDGVYRWIYDQAKLVRDRAGNPLEIVGYWADITERKQLEEEIRSALEKEKELNELKSRFISMTSHEFRTPLSTILSSCELLEHYRHKWTQEKQLNHLHRIQNAVKRMTEMFNDVLFISKEEAGKLDCRTQTLDLVQYCRHLVEEVQQNLSCHESAQPSPRIAFSSQYQFMPCCMDENLLEHILSNLLSNAIKYSNIDSTVKFTLTKEDGRAIFVIQDQGIGIPQEDLLHLYESFHRATNVGNRQGTGLGLAIVKKCVDIHQGEIFVKSELGAGTTFTVILPLNKAD